MTSVLGAGWTRRAWWRGESPFSSTKLTRPTTPFLEEVEGTGEDNGEEAMSTSATVNGEDGKRRFSSEMTSENRTARRSALV